MLLRIITPEKIAFSEEVEKVSLPSADGQITILPKHTPLVTSLKAGELIAHKETKTINLAIGEGFAEIDNQKVTVLTDMAETAEGIDEKLVEEALRRAQEAMREKDLLSEEEFALTIATIEKSLAQLKVKRRHRKI